MLDFLSVSCDREYMNTSHGNAVLPDSRRRAAATAALKRARALAVLIALGLTFGMARAAGVNPDQPIRLNGIELFFGIIPAEILRGYPSDREERSMHGGVPHGKGAHHLIITVFDAKTRARIRNAAVTASITEIGMATQTNRLEPMSFGGAVSYGNYFAMSNQGPYEIVVNVRRPSDSKTSTARFQYRLPP